MKKLKKKYIDILEKNDFNISSYTDDGRVEIEFYSPAGEDFIFCVNVNDFSDSVTEYVNNFDPDEHTEMWVHAKYNGQTGIPTIRELIHDADVIEQKLFDLSIALKEVR